MNFAKKLFVAIAAVAMPLVQTVAQGMPPLPNDPQVRIGKLPNGITYYIRHNAEPKDRAYFYIAQKVGSVQEEESQRGLAHFLEHMCFNGTKNFPGNSMIKWLESIGVKFGAELNAYTSTDETVYNIDAVPVTPAHVDSCLLILHDWADGLLLEEKEIDKERGVIHEEWRLRSSASMRIFERNLEKIYPGSRYGKRFPIGLMSVIDNFKYKELRDYYEKWYRPDHQGIIVVGDINVDEVEGKIKKIFADIAAPTTPSQYELYPVPDNNEPIIIVDKDKEQPQGVILMGFKQDVMPTEVRGTMMYYVMDYLKRLSAHALNARLAELAQKPESPFLMTSMDYDNYIMSKTKEALMATIIPKPGQDKAAVQAVFEEVERVRRFGITDTELLRAKDALMSDLEADYNNRDKQKSSYYVPKYVRHFLEGDAIPDQQTKMDTYKMIAQQMPLQQATALMQAYVSRQDTNFVFLGLYPDKEGEAIPTVEDVKSAIAAARAAKLTAYVDNVKNEPLVPTLPKAGKVKKSEAAPFGYTCLTLSNGARIFYKKTDFKDEVKFTSQSFGGLNAVKGDDLLNARQLDDVMNSTGWGNFNATELTKALAGKQASVSIYLGRSAEGLSGQSTPKDLRTLFELIYLHFQKPYVDTDAYNNYVSTLRTSLANADKVPEKAFSDSVVKTLYNNHRFVKPIKVGDVDKLNYDAIRRIYTERFGNVGDFDFFFTGAIDADSLRLFAEQYIASIPAKGKREAFAKHDLTPAKGVAMNRFARKMETPQSNLVQVWNGALPYSMKNAAIVDILSGILDQRYLKTIREEHSFAYSVGTNASLDYVPEEKYSLTIYAPVKPAAIDSTLMLIRAELEAIAKNGVQADEMDKVVQYNVKTYTDNQRNNNYWQNMVKEKVGFNRDLHTGYEATLRSVTSADIQAFVRDVLLKQNNCRTIIMQPADFKE